MESSQSPVARAKQIQLRERPSIPIPDDLGISAHLFHACIDLCSVATSRFKIGFKEISSQQQSAVVRVEQSLCMWGQRHGVGSGGLDAILQKSKHLQVVTIQTLRSILKLLAYSMRTLLLVTF
jgi:hypothetical protein